jgi:hypothetical protein
VLERNRSGHNRISSTKREDGRRLIAERDQAKTEIARLLAALKAYRVRGADWRGDSFHR